MTDQLRATRNNAAVGNYFMVCLGALALLFLVMLRRGMGQWSCLPVAVGLLGAWQRWRLAPVLTLCAVAVLLVWREPWGDARWYNYRPARTFRLPDWILCIAVLGYFAAQYRLQALTHAIFPKDPRRQSEDGDDGTPGAANTWKPDVRNPQLAKPAEIGWLLLALPLCALFAQVLWRLLPQRQLMAGLPIRVWQAIIAGWCLALVLFVAHGLLRYFGWRRRSPEGTRLLVHDTWWQETRREERRINHWLAWARLGHRRRKERS